MHLFRTQLRGVLSKVFGEPIDVISVRIDGSRREIANLHILSHSLGKRSFSFRVRSHFDEPLSRAVFNEQCECTDSRQHG